MMKNYKRDAIPGILIGVIATMMILMPALRVTNPNQSYNGLQIVFGHEFLNWGNVVSAQIEFSALNLIAYGLPILASLSLLLSKQGYLFSSILFSFGAILLYFIPSFTTVTTTLFDNVMPLNIDWLFGSGLIIALVLSNIGAISNLLLTILNRD